MRTRVWHPRTRRHECRMGGGSSGNHRRNNRSRFCSVGSISSSVGRSLAGRSVGSRQPRKCAVVIKVVANAVLDAVVVVVAEVVVAPAPSRATLTIAVEVAATRRFICVTAHRWRARSSEDRTDRRTAPRCPHAVAARAHATPGVDPAPAIGRPAAEDPAAAHARADA